MNRYPLWKYALLVVALLVGLIYTLPNLFGEAPAVQVSSARVTVKVDDAVRQRVEQAIAQSGVTPDFVHLEAGSVRARFHDTDAQIKAKDAIAKALNGNETADPTYIVALNLVSRSPQWLTALHAFPMYLGLDLRGGVHFLMQVDMKAALTKKAESTASDVRTTLRDKNIRHAGISREGNDVVINFRDEATRTQTLNVLRDQVSDFAWVPSGTGTELRLTGSLTPKAEIAVQDAALKQNITTLHNRVNELGVAEPVILQQGRDRIVVQLPGVQDTAKAKDIIGRTATLEVRMVDESAEASAALAGTGPVPFGTERFTEKDGSTPIIVKRQVVITGDNLNDAQPSFDENHQPAVSLKVDAKGARIMKDVSRENIGKRMAIMLFEKGKGEVVTVAHDPWRTGQQLLDHRRQHDHAGSQRHRAAAARRLAGRADGDHRGTHHRPVAGRGQHRQGHRVGHLGLRRRGDLHVPVLHAVRRVLRGRAVGVNLLLLLAVLSMLQATLTLPGIAAIALALGMAIDANVLINERVREELRAGLAPQQAIHAGYERAWATILDSNVTTLIAGLALLAFGSGPIKGFAVVHCLGILTSMFSSVMFSRALVNLWYGRRKSLKSVAIGTVWKPGNTAGTPADPAAEAQ